MKLQRAGVAGQAGGTTGPVLMAGVCGIVIAAGALFIGDPVYRGNTAENRTLVGRITRVEWSRVSGSLEVEFDPEPFQRVAVGDEVWIDLNPE